MAPGHTERRLGIEWSSAVELELAVKGISVPSEPGLYRVRRVGLDGWDYIGQTGARSMNLRKRMTMLKGVFETEMPYRDPHTGGPALWSLRHQSQASFEAEFCPVQGSTQVRKGLEAVAIAVHRQEFHRSPTFNFGRMPAGYRMSSGNNARLVAAGRRFRGGPTSETTTSHAAGIPPLGPLDHACISETWCGHHWTRWRSLTEETLTVLVAAAGLYRIKGRDGDLVYIGEGEIKQRLRAHAAKLRTGTVQGQALAGAVPLEFSSVANSRWERHQRLELETDLIAAHVLAVGTPPEAQFLG